MMAIGADELARRLNAAVGAGDLATVTRRVSTNLRPYCPRAGFAWRIASGRHGPTDTPGGSSIVTRRSATPSSCLPGLQASEHPSMITRTSGASKA